MGTADLGDGQDFDWDFLNLEQKTFLFKSVMYQQFVKIRISKVIEHKMKKQDQQDSDRYEFARQTLLGPLSEEAKPALEFAVGFFGPLPEMEKVKFLMQTPAHFDHLRAWCPKHAMLSLQPFVQKGGEIQGLEPESFLKAAELLCNHPECMLCIGHPIAKSLVRDFSNCNKLAAEHVEAKELAKGLFLEASQMKLNIPCPPYSLPDSAWLDKNQDS